MDYAVLGRTGLRVSRIGFGCAGLGNMYTHVSQEEINSCIAMAMDEYGINYFDTAPSYGPEGLSEERLGIALAGRRQNVVLTTKAGRYDHGTVDRRDYEFDYSPRRIRAEVENSLRRLKTDYIDVYQLHDIFEAQYLDYIVAESLPEMERLRRDGKIRFIGITGCELDALRYTAERSESVDAILTCYRYTLMDQTLATGFEELRRTRNIALINSSVTYLGILTTEGSTLGDYGDDSAFPEVKKVLRRVIALCKERGMDLGELAVMFGSHCGCADSTLISMARKKRLVQNMELYKRSFDNGLCMEIHEMLKDQVIFPNLKPSYHASEAKLPGASLY